VREEKMVLGIYGAGGLGANIKETAELQKQWDKLVFIDDTKPADVYKGIDRMPFAEFKSRYGADIAEVIIALGEPKYRISIYENIKRYGYHLANVVHPCAMISPSATIGEGVFVKAGAVVGPDVIVGDNTRIETYAVVGHDSIIHKHAQLSTGVIVSGHCEIGEGTYVGINVPIKENIKIGEYSVVGMGAVVQRDVSDFVIVMGNPARVVMKRTLNDLIFK